MSWDNSLTFSDDLTVKTNGYRVGEIELSTTLSQKNGIDQADDSEVTWWGMDQVGWMLPEPNRGDLASTWNQWTEMTQNWKRTDISGLEHIDHEPYRDKDGGVSTSLSVSIPAGISVGGSLNHPYIYRDVNYTTDEKIQTIYNYAQESDHEDIKHELVSTWETNRPSDGDKIAPTYYSGSFHDISQTTWRGSLFHFFKYKS